MINDDEARRIKMNCTLKGLVHPGRSHLLLAGSMGAEAPGTRRLEVGADVDRRAQNPNCPYVFGGPKMGVAQFWDGLQMFKIWSSYLHG